MSQIRRVALTMLVVASLVTAILPSAAVSQSLDTIVGELTVSGAATGHYSLSERQVQRMDMYDTSVCQLYKSHHYGTLGVSVSIRPNRSARYYPMVSVTGVEGRTINLRTTRYMHGQASILIPKGASHPAQHAWYAGLIDATVAEEHHPIRVGSGSITIAPGGHAGSFNITAASLDHSGKAVKGSQIHAIGQWDCGDSRITNIY